MKEYLLTVALSVVFFVVMLFGKHLVIHLWERYRSGR